MAKDDEDWLDPDIRALSLDSGEKAGLQVYRNYSKSFEDHAVSEFRALIDKESIDLSDLKKLLKLLVAEDVRFLPVVVCGYADDLLGEAFRRLLPRDVPGGASEMLGGYGPLSDLSKRIRLAYVFEIASRDILRDLDGVRAARNRIAHDWDIAAAEEFYLSGRIADLAPVESYWMQHLKLPAEVQAKMSGEKKFRIRLIWLAGRLTYELLAFPRAKVFRISEQKALYEKPTNWLTQISTLCIGETGRVVGEIEGSRD